VQVLLTEWDAHRGIKRASHFTTDRKRDLLEDVALHFHQQGLRYFPKADLLEVIARYLPTVNIPAEQAELVLAEISAQHALIKEQAADWYGFLHLTLQEYFTAVSLDKGNQHQLVLAHLHDPWWEEVLLLLTGMIKDATPLLETIHSARDDIFYSNLLLAGRCLAGTPRLRHPELREQTINNLKGLIANNRSYWLPRSQAVWSLREAEGERSSAYLFTLVCNETLPLPIRTAAVDTLGDASDKTIARDMLALVSNDSMDLNIREWIANSLSNFCDKSAAPSLLALLKNEALPPKIREGAARTLGFSGEKRIIPDLLALVRTEQNDYVGWRIGRALGELGAFPDPRDLRKLLGDQNIKPVTRWALSKGVKYYDQAAFAEVIKWVSDDRLDKETLWNIARYLGYLAGDGGTPKREMITLFSNEKLHISVRMCIGIALLQLGERQVERNLKEFLVDKEMNYYYVKKKVAEAIVDWGSRDISSQLMDLLHEEIPPTHSFVQLKMVDLLADIGDTTVAPELLAFLWDEQVRPHLRVRAAEALSELTLNGLIPEIKELIVAENVDSLVRGRAARCLAQDKNGVAELGALLDREDIGEEVYGILRTAARQAGVRVFAKAGGGYEILPR
jgi:HEAT repeat protein